MRNIQEEIQKQERNLEAKRKEYPTASPAMQKYLQARAKLIKDTIARLQRKVEQEQGMLW